ncbi:MAG: Eco57I restriction-modification methylase domain-containing protein [Thiomicrorhabdus sp.]|jgi:adenine-specific DNA-methyltransferase|nr:Eco57I restriction-modification methylase domain-containing protein [Thiomicrorhabdus sp.]
MADKHNQLLEDIIRSLQSFTSMSLHDASIVLLKTLGYKSDKTIPVPDSDPAAFLELLSEHNPGVTIDKEKALFNDWVKADILFQLTDEELSTQQISLFKNDSINSGLLQSYLFFSIELKQQDYVRGKLTAIARQLNRVFPMPVMVFIKHSDLLSIAVINRRINKRDSEKDVLGKVTIIRDISLIDPHRGHLDILASFALQNLVTKATINNFDNLHTAWEEIFNVELLNERFYKELFKWYFWALPQIQFPDDLKPEGLSPEKEVIYYEKLRATGLIRLLTRLIFCWFLKEKDLIPETLFDVNKLADILTNLDDDKSTYHQAILQNLFFATLNQRMNARGEKYRVFAKDEGFLKNRNTYGVDNLYRYESLFRDSEASLTFFEDIPFLNGGLFECLDYTDDKGKKIYVDGFSRNKKKRPIIPNRFFFGEGEVNMGDVTGEKRRGTEKVRGLINILSDYRFTIVENTPIDQEIALDPELLGKVFENLLASYNEETKTTARKQTGSFYTPRPIVDYMVDESLKVYLTTALSKQYDMKEGDARTGLDILFAYTEKQHVFEEDEVVTLIKAIDSCKILDPACGSGAFPMGILHKLVYILTKLDPDNVKWKRTQLSKLDSAPMREELERTFENNNDDYGRKLYLIENCLYGVDIQPIAIQISKLRFFISLICDQKTNKNKAKNHGVKPLPNLETKFVAADTLVTLDNATCVGLTQQDHFDFDENIKIEKIEKEMQQVRHDHFAVQTRQKKIALQKKDKELRKQLASELMRSAGIDSVTSQNLATWDPYDPKVTADFFEPIWMFDRSISSGFDLVIGNPPYMRIQGIRQNDPKKADFYKKHYTSATGSFDLYVIFMERGLQFLSKQGILNYINPDKWVNASFGKGIRSLAVKNQNVHRLISFGEHQVFSACTYSSLVWMGNEASDSILFTKIEPSEDVSISLNDELSNIDFSKIPYRQLTSDPWILTSGANTDVMNKILESDLVVGDCLKIFVGLQTSKDTVYFLKNAEEFNNYFAAYSPELDERIEIEKGLVKPLLLGDQVHRYETLSTEKLVIFPYNLPKIPGGKPLLMTATEIEEDYPKGWNYLKRCENVLRGRERGRLTNDTDWYRYIYPKNLNLFKEPKLIAPDISLGGNFSIDCDGKYYTTTTLYGYLKKDNVWESYEYWLALLNSTVLWFYLKNSGSVLANGYFRYKPAYLENFPIPTPSREQEKTISKLSSLALLANCKHDSAEQRDTNRIIFRFLEDLIDACVFELYFSEHMAERDLLFLDDAAVFIEKYNSNEFGTERQKFLTNFYQTANSANHPIRNRLMRLTADSPDLIAVIKGKGKACGVNG